MRSEERLKAIKEKDASYHLGGTTLENDWKWLIKQAETLHKIADTWVGIETNGNHEDADEFYTIVQDILSDNGDY